MENTDRLPCIHSIRRAIGLMCSISLSRGWIFAMSKPIIIEDCENYSGEHNRVKGVTPYLPFLCSLDCPKAAATPEVENHGWWMNELVGR
jgi:hypothetical protein